MSMSKEGVAAVQPTKNKRKHQLSSGFRRQEMAERANSSDLEICWMADVVNIFDHRQGSVNVKPDIFNMAFEENIMIADSQVFIL